MRRCAYSVRGPFRNALSTQRLERHQRFEAVIQRAACLRFLDLQRPEIIQSAPEPAQVLPMPRRSWWHGLLPAA